MKPSFTYKLIFPEGQFYFGSTTDIEKRLVQHQDTLEKGRHQNIYMQAIYKPGLKFDVEIDAFATIEEARQHEQKLITENKDGQLMLNIGLSALGGDNLSRHPNKVAIIAKRTETVLLYHSKLSDEERQRIYGKFGKRNGMFEQNHTEESKELMSIKMLGNKHALGAVRSAEQRKAISDHAKTRTGETNPFHGKQHSEETKKRLSELNAGKLPPNTRRVSIDGKEYISATAASKELGVAVMTIVNRINNPHQRFSGYSYLD